MDIQYVRYSKLWAFKTGEIEINLTGIVILKLVP